jgi:tetratricopeptide (TPR) repeat protein
MSYIHEALKKAQKERDARYLKYSGIFSGSGKRMKFFNKKAVVWVFLPLAGISLAFAFYSWLDSGAPQVPKAPEFKYKKAETVPRKEKVVDADVLFERGRIFHKKGRFEDAARLYRQTLGVAPNRVDAINNLGVIYIHEKDYQAAQSNFEKAIRIKPKYVDPHYNMACLYAIKGEILQSLVHLKKAVSLDKSVRDWARRDTDLEKARRTPEFEGIIRD